MRIPLNDQKIRGIKPPTTARVAEYFDASFPGFALRVTSKGRKSFIYMTRVQGQLQRFGLIDPDTKRETFPDLSLKRAREVARVLRDQIATGGNPRAAHAAAQAKQAEDDSHTFAALCERYLDGWAKPRKRTWKADAQIIRTELTSLADRPVLTITRADVRALLDAVVARGGRTWADRILACLRKILNYGIDLEWVAVNPCARIKNQRSSRHRRTRLLSKPEIVQFWQYLDQPPVDAEASRVRLWPLLAAWLRLRLVLAQRGEDVLRMRWAHLSEPGVWIQPGDQTKNGEPHAVPLPALALGILDTVRAVPRLFRGEDFVFAGIRSRRDRHNVCAGLGLVNFEYRDLRRTAATHIAASSGRFIVKRVLNHLDAEVTGVYDLYAYLPEKRAALEAWSAELSRLTEMTAASGAA